MDVEEYDRQNCLQLVDEEMLESNLGSLSSIGQIDILNFYLKHPSAGRYLDTCDNRGWTPLHAAAFSGQDACLTAILKKAQEYYDEMTFINFVNRQSHEGYTALSIACYSAHSSTVSLLCSYVQVDVNLPSTDGDTPLRRACVNGNYECVSSLINRRVDINACDFDGWAPLHECAQRGHDNLAKLLIQHGANIFNVTHNSVSSFMVACQHNQRSMIDLLIREATKHGRVQEMLLMETGDGDTVVHTCIREANLPLLAKLLSLGADVNRNAYEYIADERRSVHPVALACRYGAPDILRLLLPYTDVQAVASTSDDPVYHCIDKGTNQHQYRGADCIRILIKHRPKFQMQRKSSTRNVAAERMGANILLRPLFDHNLITPLGKAIAKSNREIVKQLMAVGCNVTIDHKSTYSPLNLALYNYTQPEIVETILKYASVNVNAVSYVARNISEGQVCVPDAALICAHYSISMYLEKGSKFYLHCWQRLIQRGLQPRLHLWCRCRPVKTKHNNNEAENIFAQMSILEHLQSHLGEERLIMLVRFLAQYTGSLPTCCDAWRNLQPSDLQVPTLQSLARWCISCNIDSVQVVNWHDCLALLPKSTVSYLKFNDIQRAIDANFNRKL